METNALLTGSLGLAPLNSISLRDRAYVLLKDAIAATDLDSQIIIRKSTRDIIGTEIFWTETRPQSLGDFR